MGEQHHHPKLENSAHDLGVVRGDERSRLAWVLVITAIVIAGEVAAYFLSGSLAVLNDAFHFFTHFVTIALSYLAIVIALRPAPADKTYRYWRLEILASLVSGISLIPVSGFVLYEAVERWFNPQNINARWVIILGAVGLGANAFSALLLHHHSKHDHNMRGAFLHMLADSVSSLGVLIAGAVIYFTGWKKADPLIAGGISLLILGWCYTLVRDAGRILLESAPRHMKLEDILAVMKGVDGVVEVHDLHVWTITSRMYSLTAHVRLREDLPVSRTEEIACTLRRLLDERWEINHTTLQFEIGVGEALDCERPHAPAAAAPHPHDHAH
jgi:cobalt-zinc-cadmium efflux system protein